MELDLVRGKRGSKRDLLGYVAFFLRRLAAAVVVGEADAGGAVGLADYLDHVCWGAWMGVGFLVSYVGMMFCKSEI